MDPLRAQIEAIVLETLDKHGVLAKQELAFLATDQAAALAAVSTGTIRRWVREGRLTARGAGRELRIERGEILALIQNGRSERPRPNPPRGGGGAGGAMSPEACAARDDARESVARSQQRVARTPKRKLSGA